MPVLGHCDPQLAAELDVQCSEVPALSEEEIKWYKVEPGKVYIKY